MPWVSTAVVGGGGELRSLKERVSRGQCFDSKGKEVENQYPTKVLGERRGMYVCVRRLSAPEIVALRPCLPSICLIPGLNAFP